MSKLYTERDIIEQGDYYSRHMSAMTGEGLDRKSDIAAELAHRDIQIDQLQARFAELEARICRTCDGHGMIGGPSYSQPDEGGEPCPDCDAFIFRKQAEAVQASRQGVGGDSESIIGFHNALQRVKKIFSEYRQDWPKWGKRLDGTPALNDLPVRIAAAFSELYTHPASRQVVSVPQQWRDTMEELAADLESEIENRRSGELDRRIERDLIVVREARALLAEQEQYHE